MTEIQKAVYQQWPNNMFPRWSLWSGGGGGLPPPPPPPTAYGRSDTPPPRRRGAGYSPQKRARNVSAQTSSELAP